MNEWMNESLFLLSSDTFYKWESVYMNVKNETHYLECSGVRIAFNGYDAKNRFGQANLLVWQYVFALFQTQTWAG